MARAPVLIVGAGIGGLAAAVALAAQGRAVTLLERDDAPGGKLKALALGDHLLDAGPTVMTLRSVFDQLFALAGEHLDDHLRLTPLHTLARHAWPDGSRLDLHADRDASADAIGRLAGAAAARQYLAFCERSRQVYAALDAPYLRAPRPDPVSLALRCAMAGPASLLGLVRGTPMQSLWRALGRQFADGRLRQLFARYATYGGSSPLQAPATLMLIAHVEQAGVWSVEGGMYRLAQALSALAQRHGAQLRCNAGVRRLRVTGGRVVGVELDDGETLDASAVVFNGDPAALPAGLLGEAARPAVRARPPQRRSLSALTWNLVAPASGFPLLRHNVFFSSDYPLEFDELFHQRRLPTEPTVYICAQDRGDLPRQDDGTPERLLCLVNAPASDVPAAAEETDACEFRTFRHLERLGLRLAPAPAQTVRHTPWTWATRFPASGGALYGQATHGWTSSFNRPAAATRLPGLFLAGGSTHPGAGVPLAALSGLLAAQACLAEQPGPISTGWSPPVAMPGGTSTR